MPELFLKPDSPPGLVVDRNGGSSDLFLLTDQTMKGVLSGGENYITGNALLINADSSLQASGSELITGALVVVNETSALLATGGVAVGGNLNIVFDDSVVLADGSSSSAPVVVPYRESYFGGGDYDSIFRRREENIRIPSALELRLKREEEEILIL